MLIVDDDVDGTEALKYLLESHGLRVETAENGRVGLDYLRKGDRPCVIILDLLMPVMGGVEFLAERDRDPELAHAPVIVVTASPAQLGDRRLPVLQKPVDARILLERIRSVCDGGG